jgi:hypothetical protein
MAVHVPGVFVESIDTSPEIINRRRLLMAASVAKAGVQSLICIRIPPPKTPEQMAQSVDNMDQVGVDKTVILAAAVGRRL